MSNFDEIQAAQLLAAHLVDQQSQQNQQTQKNIAHVNEVWSQKEKNISLRNQNEQVEKQNNFLAGRANRAEDEIREAKEKLSSMEQALVAHSLATDEAFQELMLEFYGAAPDKEARVKKDLAKLKYRTQQIIEKNKSIPNAPNQDDIDWYVNRLNSLPIAVIEMNDEALLKVGVQKTDIRNKICKLYNSLIYWKKQGKFLNIPLNRSELIEMSKL